MKTLQLKSLLTIALSIASFSAFASTYEGSCTDQPKSKWMPANDVKAKFEKEGYSVKRVKTAKTCYEVYAKDKDGKKTELFVNPVDATLVKEADKK
jgi:hypothetical protein